MKNLKQHIIELEKYRNHLCQMKENVEPDNKDVDCHDQDDQCLEKERIVLYIMSQIVL